MNTFVVGQNVRFRYQGGNHPGMIRVVQVTEVGANYIEGYDLTLNSRPYRRFIRSKMENVVFDGVREPQTV